MSRASTIARATLEFQSDADEIEGARPPWTARLTLYVLLACVVSAVVWASVATVDRIVVAHGKLVTTASTLVVQPLETSIVRSIDVTIGELVHRGDTLATLDQT